MITATERLTALQHRKHRKNKSQMQASQDMVNAFDKISVSVRRAQYVNRCQQDHLDSRVWTLENEHRKSMGLLALEQKRFIRTRKSSNAPLKPEQKHQRKRRKLSNFSVLTEKDSQIKMSWRLPTLVDTRKIQHDDSDKNYQAQALYGKGFVGLKPRDFHQRQDINNRNNFPSIQETQLNGKQSKDTSKSRRNPTDKWLQRNTGLRQDVIDKQQYVASWDITASEKTFNKTGKSYSNLSKTPLALSQQQNAEESTKPNENISNNDHTSVQSDHDTESPKSLANKKLVLIRSGTNTTSELDSILDKATEIRVKEFLKLPRIGGIHETATLPEDAAPENAGGRNHQPRDSLHGKRSRANLEISHTGKERARSSLWKNLAQCRYLRLGEQHVCEHKLNSDNNCECHWCGMMRKSRA